jgi:hypothetical protein
MDGAALLKTMEDTGVAVLTLTEGLEDSELLASRLTRSEVARQLRLFTEAATALPIEQRDGMPEVDWGAIAAAGLALGGPGGPALDEALILGARTLAPSTLMWLRVYRHQQPPEAPLKQTVI